MLNVYLGYLSKAVNDVSSYFDLSFEESWFVDNSVKSLIKDIDRSDLLEGCHIESPMLGTISPADLSDGCKALIAIYNDSDLVVCGERFSDRCFKWLFELGKTKEIKITLSHIPHFDYSFDMRILNSGVVVHDSKSFMTELILCREKGLICYD